MHTLNFNGVVSCGDEADICALPLLRAGAAMEIEPQDEAVFGEAHLDIQIVDLTITFPEQD